MRMDKRMVTGIGIAAGLVVLGLLWPSLSPGSCPGLWVFLALGGFLLVICGAAYAGRAYGNWMDHWQDRD